MATGGESVPLMEQRHESFIRFADDSVDLQNNDSPRSQSISSNNSFNLHFPEFLRSFSIGSEQDSDFDELDGLPDVDFPETGRECMDNTDGVEGEEKEIPFKAIHRPPESFGTIRRNCWIPGVPVQVKILSSDRHQAHIKLFSPNLYTIAIKHGEYEWTIRRRYKHFHSLHQQLQLYKVRCKMPMPTKSQRRRRLSVKGTKNKIPRFPKRPEIMVRDMEKRKNYLEEYLQNVLNINIYRNHHETLKFFEVSPLSFVKKLGKKWREGPIKKCSGGRRISIGCCGCLKKFHLAGNWKKRWLVAKDSFVAYIRPRDGLICDVMLMDSEFKVDKGMGATGAPHGVLISNLSRNLLAKCWTGRKADEWQENIEAAMSTGMGKDYTQKNRFNSFAPVREKSYAKWFIDGSTYFSAVAEALESAKEEIFITDWWLSPEIYLKRHTVDWNKWRLDTILERKAKEGVKIFILLYKEMSVALNISSIYSKHILTQACRENIKVLRHPDHGAGGVLLWAHHEKIVCVDQKVAFLGGLDLCYGRWDDGQHKLTDLGSIVYDNMRDGHKVHKGQGEGEVDEEGVTISITPPSPNQDLNKRLFTPEEPNPPSLTGDQDSQSLNKDQKSQSENRDQKSQSQNRDQECICTNHKADSDHSYVNGDVKEETSKDEKNKKETSKNEINRTESTKNRKNHNESPKNRIKHDQSTSDSNVSSILEIDIPWNSDEEEGGENTQQSDNQQEVNVTVHDHDSKSNESLRNIVNYMQNQALKSKAKSSWQNSQNSPNRSKVKSEPVKSNSNTCIKNDEKIDVIKEEDNNSDENSILPRSKSAKEFRFELEQSKKEKAKNKASEKNNLEECKKKKSEESKKSKSKKKQNDGIIEKGFRKIEEDLPVFIDPNEQMKKKDKEKTEGVKMRDKSSPSRNSKEETISKTSVSRESWARRKLRSSLSKRLSLETENNNKKDNIEKENQESKKRIEGDGDGEGQEDEINEHIRNRWRLVLNVKKFHQNLQQPQMMTPLPNLKKEPLSAKISHKIRDKLKPERKDSLDGIREEEFGDYLDTPLPGLHKTSSEQKIDELGLVGSSKLWIGKDYVNFIFKDFVDLHDPFEDFIDRTETPRMPWHDIGGVVYGKAARDVARHFIGRWNVTKVEKAKNDKRFPLLLPKGYTPHNLVPQIIRDQCDEVKSQILRSAGGWSCGILKKECSIQTAYLHCIESAKHYIYIENQFFITYVGDHGVVKNEIGEALHKRIVRAHRNNETFRVYVVMPLLPAFEGEIGKSGAYAIKAITHYNYTSICKGNQSLWQQLINEGVEPLNYIVFCGLRTHSELNGKLISELVYVHSKLMIVDDDTVIFGSANINDRSMLGDRDSEIAIMTQDIHKHKVKMNGVEHMAGKFASSLRKSLFREHLGIDPVDSSIDLSDPVSNEFYKNFYLRRATVNTAVYDKVFRCLPNNSVLTFHEADLFTSEKPMSETNPAAAREQLKKVRGYIVLMPLKFLDKESSIIPFGKEAFLPNSVWV